MIGESSIIRFLDFQETARHRVHSCLQNHLLMAADIELYGLQMISGRKS